jgi:hypothetical protein
MLTLLRVAPFALLLVAGGVVVATRWSRRAVNLFIAIFVGASCVAGFGQRDLWPFSPYPVVAERADRWRESVWYELRAVDARGAEHPWDMSPLTRSAVEHAMTRTTTFLPPPDGPIANDRYLGPLAAPDWLLSKGRPARTRTMRVYRHDVRGTALVREYALR